MPYRNGRAPALMEALGGVGSDIRNFECPRCGAHDRERHLLLYMRATGLFDRLASMRVLHFAPERRLSRLIAAAGPLSYTRCDLYPQSVGVLRVNIEEMPFDDGSFDLLVANHVLEHVDDDLRAVGEIARVLAPDGMAILQTPYSAMLCHTWSDPGINSDAARLQAYGQEDHVRLYGSDIFARITSRGFRSCVGSHAALLPGTDARKLGVNAEEPFFLFKREG